MINDLFSSFDFTTNSLLNIFPTIIILFALLLIPLFSGIYFTASNKNTLFSQLEYFWSFQLKNSKNTYLKFASSFILTLFFTILFLNIFRINPYFFPSTVHIIFSLGAAWLTWLSVILSRLTFKTFKFLAQFLPLGTPLWLAPFISIIEFFRTAVRPITLGFRLTANIIIGHIILSLIRICLIVVKRSWVFAIILSILCFYFVFELIICFIQASVFSLLTSIYVLEHS
jgi:F-type H+-transporting ATPase subunit a